MFKLYIATSTMIIYLILTRFTLVTLFSDAFQLVRFQNDRLRQTRSELNSTKSDLNASQKQVIGLQEQVILSKEQNLQSVQKVVATSVSESMKAEIKSYSQVVKSSSSGTVQISSENCCYLSFRIDEFWNKILQSSG